MLTRLVGFSIEHRGVVVALACLVAAFGIYTTITARYDVYPEFSPPRVVVQTEAPGFSPLDVEQLVTRPVEYALNGMPSLASIRSQSIQGLSVVTVLFTESTDIYRARQLVNERLSEVAGQLPQGVMTPRMAPLTGATSTVLDIGLTSKTRSPMDLRTFADWTIRPRLLSVPGVAQVSIYGGDVKQLQIQAEPDRMAAYHVSLADIMAAARAASGVRGGGFIETPAQRVVMQTIGQSLTPAQLGNVVLAGAGEQAVRLKDVATIRDAPRPKIGGATIMGGPGVFITIESQYGSNIPQVTKAVEAAFKDLAPAIRRAHIELHPALFRPADFIAASVRGIGHALLIGAVLVAVVLLLFLLNFRVAAISLTAIPLSLLIAIVILDRSGQSLNTMTLSGLAIAIGVVVDDAIIDAENIFRRLRQAGGGLSRKDLFLVVLDASIEVRSSVIYATFIVALVFVPVLLMSGMQGRLFSPLGASYIYATLASLLIALTLTPALSYLLLPKAIENAAEPRYITSTKKHYEQLLRRLSQWPYTVMLGGLVLVLVALAAVPFLGGSLLPPLREGHFIAHMTALPGTSLTESERLGGLISRALLRDPDVRTVAQQIGRAELGIDTDGVNYSEFQIDLKPISGREAVQAESKIRDVLSQFPVASFSVNTFLTERMQEISSGVGAQVVIRVFGDNLDAIDQKARQILQVLAGIPGAVDAQLASPPGAPQLIIRLRPQRLLQFGFRPIDLLDAIQTAYGGAIVGQIYQGNRVFDVSVILPPALRNNPEAVGSLILQNTEGARVPLDQLADIYERNGRYTITHYGTRRVQEVLCNVSGRSLTSFVHQAEQAVRQKVKFPGDLYAVFAGASQARSQAQHDLLVYSLIAAVGILLLLSIAFHNFRNTALVLANLPFALVGGVFAAFLTGGNLSVGSMVGFVALFGITMRNSMMMISHFEHLVAKEGEHWGLRAAIRGASERFNPILMTAIVTGLGLLPLAIGSGEPGKEIEGPMAIVIVGGLVTSTVLNLLLLPTLALRYGRFGATGLES
ncbi:MAG TPA: efflux RND transporter permease subunit [Bryobacteraceae bacterium]